VRDAALAVLGDGLTVAPLARVASLHSASQGTGNTYFAHILPGDSIPSREFPQVKPQTCTHSIRTKLIPIFAPQRPGSVKGEDVAYWLAQPLLPPGWPSLLTDKANYSQQDAQMSKACVHYLGNFIRSGWVVCAVHKSTLHWLDCPSLHSTRGLECSFRNFASSGWI
jgi:hypothetical protein